MTDVSGESEGPQGQEGHEKEAEQEVGDDTPIFVELMKGHPALSDLFSTQDNFEKSKTQRDNVVCQICQIDEEHHGERQHAFTPPGARVDTSQFTGSTRRERQRGDDASRRQLTPQNVSQRPFDPVLRIALIDAGILTIEQLEQAERKMNLMTSDVIGVRPRSSPGREDESNARPRGMGPQADHQSG